MLPLLAATIWAIGSLAKTSQHSDLASYCEEFGRKIHVDNVTVNFAQYLPKGTNLTLDGNPPSCDESYQVIETDLCRIAMAVATSEESQITFEAWFPSNYSGRFLSTGNGGLAGCIQYDDMAYASSFGFATVGANGGHNGTSGEPFFHNLNRVEDLSWRSMHTGVVVGKILTNMFYAEGFKKSYYLGCSTGGRQGFKAVQAFPLDFDGVVAGCPAVNFVNLTSWSGHFLPITGNASADTFLSPDQWTLVQQEIMSQCDPLDGAVDGVISDPDLCYPTLERLICNPAQNSSDCLTGTQLHTVYQILSPVYGVNGTWLYPRMQPGVEALDAHILYNGEPFAYSTDWYRYVVYDNPDWDPRTLNAQDYMNAVAQNPSNIQTWDGDLSAFHKAGGKVLTYHGTADPIISSEISKAYYAHVAETMNMAPEELDDFYRYFRIGGMNHCGGGTGATSIGNTLSSYVDDNPEDNVLMAIVRWVEEGIAPEFIRGASLVNGTGSAVAYRRKHCKFPTRSQYKGPGNWTDEDAWECI